MATDPTDPTDATEAALRDLLASTPRGFRAATLLLPPRARGPAAAVWAFWRLATRAVEDLAPGPGLEALAGLSARLDRIYAGAPADHPVERAFAAVAARYRLPRGVADAMLEGLRWDLERRSYEQLEELRAYCVRAGATVGMTVTLVLGARTAPALARACDLGVALQLVRVVRDLPEHLRLGRLYLPRAWLAEVGVDPAGLLRAPAFTPALGDVLGRLLDQAEALFARADAGIAALPRDCQPAITSARLVYSETARVLRRAGPNPFAGHGRLSTARKLTLVARSLGRVDPAPLLFEEPPLPEARFLVDAVVAAEPSGSTSTRL